MQIFVFTKMLFAHFYLSKDYFRSFSTQRVRQELPTISLVNYALYTHYTHTIDALFLSLPWRSSGGSLWCSDLAAFFATLLPNARVNSTGTLVARSAHSNARSSSSCTRCLSRSTIHTPSTGSPCQANSSSSSRCCLRL